jgi:hypothetical protein
MRHPALGELQDECQCKSDEEYRNKYGDQYAQASLADGDACPTGQGQRQSEHPLPEEKLAQLCSAQFRPLRRLFDGNSQHPLTDTTHESTSIDSQVERFVQPETGRTYCAENASDLRLHAHPEGASEVETREGADLKPREG